MEWADVYRPKGLAALADRQRLVDGQGRVHRDYSAVTTADGLLCVLTLIFRMSSGTSQSFMTDAYAELPRAQLLFLLDGASSPEALVSSAQALGLTALALTDHNSLAGIVRFWKAAKPAGFHSIFGVEVTLTDSDSTEADPSPSPIQLGTPNWMSAPPFPFRSRIPRACRSPNEAERDQRREEKRRDAARRTLSTLDSARRKPGGVRQSLPAADGGSHADTPMDPSGGLSTDSAQWPARKIRR